MYKMSFAPQKNPSKWRTFWRFQAPCRAGLFVDPLLAVMPFNSVRKIIQFYKIVNLPEFSAFNQTDMALDPNKHPNVFASFRECLALQHCTAKLQISCTMRSMEIFSTDQSTKSYVRMVEIKCLLRRSRECASSYRFKPKS